ncbi:MAG TPA: NAD(P)H-hydrate dehydratase [Opitutaceae bacterium]|nr:NAD(P)H-hydrate dehydratase [Opitutaceae bacterium]
MSLPSSIPILICAEASAWEKKLFSGDEAAEWAALQRAGGAVGAAALQDFLEMGGFPPGGRILVLVGKGHNGGDALLAAKFILEKNPAASAGVIFAFGERTLRPLARRAWQALVQAAPARVAIADDLDASCDLCLDGIFGFQFRPPIDATTAKLLRRINGHPAIRLRAAVDLPSGVGEKPGEISFRADFTYATGTVKLPLLTAPAAGRLRFLDLGFFQSNDLPAVRDRVLTTEILRPLTTLRSSDVDKRTFGHLLVLGGSRSYPGAVLMTVLAALRSGVGLVTAFVPESLAPAFAARAPEAMWVGLPETPSGGLAHKGLALVRARLPRATAFVLGPGLGTEAETRVLVEEIVRLARMPLLLDADALQPSVLAATSGKRVVLTPHEGEFARINHGAELRTFCKTPGMVVALKGPTTRISDAEGAVYHSFFGGPVLARGGSGDLLAGLIGGLLAQTPADPLLAVARGVAWHGLAADALAREHGQVAVQTTQLLDFLPAALRAACAGQGD